MMKQGLNQKYKMVQQSYFDVDQKVFDIQNPCDLKQKKKWQPTFIKLEVEVCSPNLMLIIFFQITSNIIHNGGLPIKVRNKESCDHP